MTEKFNFFSRYKNYLLLTSIALVLSFLSVLVIEQIVVTRGLVRFQEKINLLANHLSDGKEKAVVLGSMIMMGGVNPIIRATAQGTLKPDNDKVMDLLKRIQRTYALGNIRIVDSTGKVVAYFTQSGKSATGEIRSTRPYFVASMNGTPSMYPALGHTSGSRGFYIAAPIYEKDATIDVSWLGFIGKTADKLSNEIPPHVIGAIVAKIGFEEVDFLLKQETDSLIVISPEGVVFSTNVPDWQFRVFGIDVDIEHIKKEQRVNEAFEKSQPRLLEIDKNGMLLKDEKTLKLVQSTIDWKDPHGSWRLIGFADPSKIFGNLYRLSVGTVCFSFLMLFGSWWQARRRVTERTGELEQANLHLAKLSITDGLTNIFNRRHFDEVLANESLRAKRNGQPMALVMLDIDFFKKYNDNYGHPAGDLCLQKIAGILKSSMRRGGDIAARYGGEEFALILPNTDAAGAHSFAESVRQSIEQQAIPHALSPSGIVTVSMGISIMHSDAIKEDTQLLLHAADKALYNAKNDGRNRVMLAQKEIIPE